MRWVNTKVDRKDYMKAASSVVLKVETLEEIWVGKKEN